MRILLIGEYSLLHNSLKDGLKKSGHQVVLASSGDGFKDLPADFLYTAIFSQKKIVNLFRQFVFKFFCFDIAEIERGLRFWRMIHHFKNFDIVQLINECPIQTMSFFELFLLKKIFKNNQKIFLLSSGVDFLSVKYMFDNPAKKSIMIPFFKDNSLTNDFQYVLKYLDIAHQKTHNFVYRHCKGIIASDIDYVLPLVNNPKFLGLIPNPVNIQKLEYVEFNIKGKVVIFLGKNSGNAIQKGTYFFEEALKVIEAEFKDKVKIIIVENIPYAEYINLYNQSHIVLDQVYAHDQGYNALEAMAKGKIVFTGAETEFEKYYNLDKKVAINAIPNVDYLVNELRFLILNRAKMYQISVNARNFVIGHHDYIQIAKKYIETWTKKN